MGVLARAGEQFVAEGDQLNLTLHLHVGFALARILSLYANYSGTFANMPAPERAKLKEKTRRLPDGPGVYLMRDRLGTIIYVGKAKNLKRRVASYFQPSRRLRAEQPKVAAMLPLIHDFETITVRSENEALLLEGRLIKEWKPRYNTDFTDDKRFLLLRIDPAQPLPRFRLVRFRTGDNALYYGPFPHSGPLRQTLREMRRRFGILTGDAQPVRLADGRWRLHSDIRAEISGHPNEVSEDAYRTRVAAACAFLEGKSREWLVETEAAMQAAAAAQDYERAAAARDLLLALRETITRQRRFARGPLLPRAAADALPALAEALGLPAPPQVIECFDISHISGSFCVASMVRFVAGKPDRAGYRRYHIRGPGGNDDYAAMAEVVDRRYRRLCREGRPLPDLVLIDGGAGQVTAALAALRAAGIEPPPLAGLAKREETLHLADGRAPLQLPGHHPGRLLLQRIRDEAHRFANSFNADLRSRRLRESMLDDIPGLGPVKRRALLERYRSLARIRAASATDLAAVPGIGPRLAAAIHAHLAAPDNDATAAGASVND
jgi:excinuclease ABC subunit C